MPDGRVTTIIKGMMVALAAVRPDVVSVEQAKTFSAKSLRTGGTSEAAACVIREGVLQGHGGWAARKSLDSYDQMKSSEECVVSTALDNAVLALGPLGQEALRRRDAARAGGEVAHAEDLASGEARRGNPAVSSLVQEPDSEEDQEVDQEWGVLGIVGKRGTGSGTQYQVRWAATADAGVVNTWEPMGALRRDGQQHRIAEYEAAQKAERQRGQAATRRLRAALRTGAAPSGGGAGRLLKELGDHNEAPKGKRGASLGM